MAWRLALLAALAALPGPALALRVDGKPEPPTPLTGETTDGVVYKHLSKTGGQYIRHMILKAVGSKLHVLLEDEGLGRFRDKLQTHRRPFVIGSMRNPCDYYVSMWAYNSMEKVGMSNYAPELQEHLGQDVSSSYGSEADVQRFRKWVRRLSLPRFNYETLRFWLGYYSKSPEKYQDCRYHQGCMRDRGLQAMMAADLSRPIDHTGVDCWILTEHTREDLRTCLERYARERNATVDWSFVNKKLASPGKLQHKSEHKPCAHYYDQATADFVRAMDRPLVDAFGFQTCCTENGLPWTKP